MIPAQSDAPSPAPSVPVLLGLGANIGDPVGQITAALGVIAGHVRGLTCSSLYSSEPVGLRDQPNFVNCVCIGWTERDPLDLLGVLQGIEQALGRTRSVPNAPRTLDIDILDHGGVVLDSARLILPHPRLQERAFVLIPIAEIAPEWRHPRSGLTAAELRASARLEHVQRIGPPPAW